MLVEENGASFPSQEVRENTPPLVCLDTILVVDTKQYLLLTVDSRLMINFKVIGEPRLVSRKSESWLSHITPAIVSLAPLTSRNHGGAR